MQVLPPANGRKMWRVKRTLSVGSSTVGNDLSLECLNNSLKISAAGRLAIGKRPPAKRPKVKPGCPKDFVFVDLSPIKSTDSSDTSPKPHLSSPSISSDPPSPLSLGDLSFALSNLEEEICQWDYKTFESTSVAHDYDAFESLNFSNLRKDCFEEQPTTLDAEAFFNSLQQEESLNICQMSQAGLIALQVNSEQEQSPLIPGTSFTETAGEFQFKTYKGSNAVRTHTRRSTRSVLDSNIIFNKTPDGADSFPRSSLFSGVFYDGDLENFLHVPTSRTDQDECSHDIDRSFSSSVSDEVLQSPIDLDLYSNQQLFQYNPTEFCFPCI